MLAKRAIGHRVLAPDPLLYALGVEHVRAVHYLPHELPLPKLLEAYAARIARREGPLGRQPINDHLGLVLLSDLLSPLSHELLEERQAPEHELLSLYVDLVTCILEGIL